MLNEGPVPPHSDSNGMEGSHMLLWRESLLAFDIAGWRGWLMDDSCLQDAGVTA